jgi:hypothetical protein
MKARRFTENQRCHFTGSFSWISLNTFVMTTAPQAIPEEVDTLQQNQPLLAELYSASVSGRAALGPRAGRPVAKVGDPVESQDIAVPSGSRCAAVSGFSLHADMCIPARDRMRLERLLRYAGRPAIAAERLSLLPDGRLLYRLKRRWRDGTSHIIFEPLEFLGRLAALVPPPRFNLVRYNGVLAPAAAWRPLIIPQKEESAAPSSHSARDTPLQGEGIECLSSTMPICRRPCRGAVFRFCRRCR